ncbi:MAG TPA: hypothetical protein IAB35_04160 [Candidatus Faecimonas gallistercoris]|nr:hypothetical protein [Candidatus Faecimonas gallistercoris]
MNKKLTKKNSILFNQLWINKAIEDGNSYILVSRKTTNDSIGEIIEKRYLNEHLEPTSKKVTKHDSILYTREWIQKYIEEGLQLPTRKVANKYSVGEVLALLYKKKEYAKRQKKNKEKVLILSGESK